LLQVAAQQAEAQDGKVFSKADLLWEGTSNILCLTDLVDNGKDVGFSDKLTHYFVLTPCQGEKVRKEVKQGELCDQLDSDWMAAS
jgi:hypothetical protein